MSHAPISCERLGRPLAGPDWLATLERITTVTGLTGHQALSLLLDAPSQALVVYGVDGMPLAVLLWCWARGRVHPSQRHAVQARLVAELGELRMQAAKRAADADRSRAQPVGCWPPAWADC